MTIGEPTKDQMIQEAMRREFIRAENACNKWEPPKPETLHKLKK